MEAPSFLRRHPWVRWFAPAAVLGLAALTAAGVFAAGSPPPPAKLPRMTPESLLSQVRTAKVTGYSGTLVSRVSLGLPELPSLGGGTEASTSFASLLTGSHTLQVWYGGAQRQRIAVLGPTGETDVFRAGRSLWQWDSASRKATHVLLPTAAGKGAAGLGGLVGPKRGARASATTDPSSVTPGGLAGRILDLIRPSTAIRVAPGAPIADRSTYQLILTPRDSTTLVGSVRISVDGETKVPLAVQVVPRGASTPAIDVRYTSISFARPSRTTFAFSPPDGARVHRLAVPQPGSGTGGAGSGERRFVVHGSAWSTVACARLNSAPPIPGALAHALTPVAGPWGHGRVLKTNLVTVLLTRNGWLCAGAADPRALFAAAASR